MNRPYRLSMLSNAISHAEFDNAMINWATKKQTNKQTNLGFN